LIREANPFPAICGRVCNRSCEEHCEIGLDGDSVQIRALKRFACDYELARRPLYAKPCEIIYKEKIAVILDLRVYQLQ
jgi:NADPH-dependent glutamate synthase beta subunit-like oxidoreductase